MNYLYNELSNLYDQDVLKNEEKVSILEWLIKHRDDIENIEIDYLNDISNAQEKVAELEHRLSNCIELPQELQVGGKIFWANEDGLYSGKVYAITKDLNYEENGFNIWIYCVYNNGLTFYHLIKDFGVEIFATEEEAKAKLREIQDDTD